MPDTGELNGSPLDHHMESHTTVHNKSVSEDARGVEWDNASDGSITGESSDEEIEDESLFLEVEEETLGLHSLEDVALDMDTVEDDGAEEEGDEGEEEGSDDGLDVTADDVMNG